MAFTKILIVLGGLLFLVGAQEDNSVASDFTASCTSTAKYWAQHQIMDDVAVKVDVSPAGTVEQCAEACCQNEECNVVSFEDFNSQGNLSQSDTLSSCILYYCEDIQQCYDEDLAYTQYFYAGTIFMPDKTQIPATTTVEPSESASNNDFNNLNNSVSNTDSNSSNISLPIENESNFTQEDVVEAIQDMIPGIVLNATSAPLNESVLSVGNGSDAEGNTTSPLNVEEALEQLSEDLAASINASMSIETTVSPGDSTPPPAETGLPTSGDGMETTPAPIPESDGSIPDPTPTSDIETNEVQPTDLSSDYDAPADESGDTVSTTPQSLLQEAMSDSGRLVALTICGTILLLLVLLFCIRSIKNKKRSQYRALD